MENIQAFVDQHTSAVDSIDRLPWHLCKTLRGWIVWKRLGLVRAVMHEQPFHAASFAQSRGTVACVERGYGDGEKGVVRWLGRNERAGRPSMGQVIRATYAAFELPVARNAYRT